AEALPYGRGQLNYPLPDLSKVEPRVRFPKDDQSYRPPRGRTLPMRARGPASPVVFKSPAEIVREVLLSSAEGSPQKCPTPSSTVVPEEFRSPKEATELVQQLQEDYHRLLTKYAEAENTIDQLRLRAKVQWYYGSPGPSQRYFSALNPHSTLYVSSQKPWVEGKCCYPHYTRETEAQRACPWPQTASQFPGLDLGPSISLMLLVPGHSPSLKGMKRREPVDPLTQTLAGQARKFETQVESFEGLIQTGRLTPQAQLTGFARLKEAQDALERAYLQAREETHQQQQRPAAAGPLGVFDPDRAVEGKIFLLGLRLEELKDGIDRAVQNQPSSRSCSEPGLSPPPPPPLSCPRPSVQAPVPAVCTPYPENWGSSEPSPATHTQPELPLSSLQCLLLEKRSASGEPEEEREELPETLQHKQLQVELDYETLLDQYSRFKALPGSLSMEQDAGVNGREEPCDHSAVMFLSRPNRQPREWKPRALRPGERQLLVQRSDRLSSTQGEESLPRSRALPARPQGAGPEPSVGGKQEPLSGQSSVAGSAVSEYPPHKPFRRAKSSRPEDHRIVSPGTDSGFVGSEASRVSPLTRSPEHHFSRPATPGMLGRSGPTAKPAALRASLRKEASPVPPEKGLQDVDPSASQLPPRGSARRHSLPHGGSLSQASSPPQWTNSISSEAGPDADIRLPRGGLVMQNLPPPDLVPSGAESPTEAGLPAAAQRTEGSPLASFINPLSPPPPSQAIRALQDEVSRLRQRVGGSLGRQQGLLCLESPFLRDFQTAPHLPHPHSLAPVHAGKAARPCSLGNGPDPWEGGGGGGQPPDLCPLCSAASESDCSAPQARDGEPRATVSSWQSPPRALDMLTFRGQYTGTRYHVSTPGSPERREDTGPASCLHCRGTGTQESIKSVHHSNRKGKAPAPSFCCAARGDLKGHASAEDTLRPAQHSTPRKTLCPICSSGLSHRPETTQQQQQQPGLWYLAAPPLGTAVNYIPTVPLVPYSPPVLYCAPPAPTSVPDPAGLPPHYSSGYSVAELKPRATRQQAHHRRHSLMLGIDRLEDLNWSLSRAVEAAKSVKFTTKQMNRSLTSELSKARSLRRSCLF
uniref:AT-hook transcription factor n=1 Tax=Pelodiscus sinensis TaxID=13735 RepID=K7G7N7_PELSI